ncbi:MAG: hypothetical protein HYU57_07255 [Micavibrio aeruginosavorus]|nr:hypothetical protein [Micavibrio aeruginosavorus]
MSKTTTYNNPFAQQSAGTRPFVAALLTSQIAGLTMAVVVMAVFTLFLGKGPIFPVQVIGSIVFGEAAVNGFHAGAFLAGLVVHQGVALFWGGVFGCLAIAAKIHTAPRALALGLIVATISMVDTYILVPMAMDALHGVDIWNREVPIFWNWAAHAVFGLSYILYPKILSRLEK